MGVIVLLQRNQRLGGRKQVLDRARLQLVSLEVMLISARIIRPPLMHDARIVVGLGERRCKLDRLLKRMDGAFEAVRFH